MRFYGKAVAFSASTLVSGVVGWYLPVLQNHISTFLIPFHPIPHLFAGIGVPRSAYAWALFPFDFLLYVIVCTPFAFLITKLRPVALAWYAAVAVVPCYVALLLAYYNVGQLKFDSGAIRDAIFLLFALPMAMLLIRWLSGIGRPNNSFKPKPLRGSA
jgi:hypothetical protein